MKKLNDISHDYNHINLVFNLAVQIAKKEGITDERDLFHIKMASLLHDYEDSKYQSSNKNQAYMCDMYLRRNKNLKEADRIEIVKIASNISLSKDNDETCDDKNLKLMIVQDADRLNSLGSIGILRYISYNLIAKKEKSFDEIIANIEKRTMKIRRFIRTKTGKAMAKKELSLVSRFINNYHQ